MASWVCSRRSSWTRTACPPARSARFSRLPLRSSSWGARPASGSATGSSRSSPRRRAPWRWRLPSYRSSPARRPPASSQGGAARAGGRAALHDLLSPHGERRSPYRRRTWRRTRARQRRLGSGPLLGPLVAGALAETIGERVAYAAVIGLALGTAAWLLVVARSHAAADGVRALETVSPVHRP